MEGCRAVDEMKAVTWAVIAAWFFTIAAGTLVLTETIKFSHDLTKDIRPLGH